jgi:hypothetical protein
MNARRSVLLVSLVVGVATTAVPTALATDDGTLIYRASEKAARAKASCPQHAMLELVPGHAVRVCSGPEGLDPSVLRATNWSKVGHVSGGVRLKKGKGFSFTAPNGWSAVKKSSGRKAPRPGTEYSSGGRPGY